MITMNTGLHVITLYSSLILMKIAFPRQIFKKSSKLKLHENPSLYYPTNFISSTVLQKILKIKTS